MGPEASGPLLGRPLSRGGIVVPAQARGPEAAVSSFTGRFHSLRCGGASAALRALGTFGRGNLGDPTLQEAAHRATVVFVLGWSLGRRALTIAPVRIAPDKHSALTFR